QLPGQGPRPARRVRGPVRANADFGGGHPIDGQDEGIDAVAVDAAHDWRSGADPTHAPTHGATPDDAPRAADDATDQAASDETAAAVARNKELAMVRVV